MLKRFWRLPSPALVISAIALILAVGGGSFALAIGDKRSDKRIAKKVANRQITHRAPGLSVANANELGGKPPSAYGVSPLQPTVATLENGWATGGAAGAPAFAKDQFGVVHLFGEAGNSPTTNAVFHLPVGDRPANSVEEPNAIPTGAAIQILPDGTVKPQANTNIVGLDGLTFLAGG